MMDISNKIVLNKSIRLKKVDNRLFVANIDTFDIFEYDNIGKEIIQLIKNKKNIKEIIEIIKNEYDIEKKVILEFLNSLIVNKTILKIKKI